MFNSLADALSPVTEGCVLAVPREQSGAAMEATRALIRRDVKKLHLVTLPTSSLQADMLIGAGCVETLETSAVSLGEFGPAPCFTRAVTAGRLRVKDATCPALYAAFEAAQKGNPFMPIRGLLGSDLITHRNDWRVVDNPFADDDPVVLIPALRPDVALFHAQFADSDGNVWIGRQRDLATLAYASHRTVVTVERLYDRGSLLDDPIMAPGVLPAMYVDKVALAEAGSWPLPLPDVAPLDVAHMREYAQIAKTPEGFARYLDRHVYGTAAA